MHANEETHDVTVDNQLKVADTLLDTVLTTLDDRKAMEIITIPLSGKSTIADYMVIANGNSARQVAAIADHVITTLRNQGFGRVKVEGLPQADWVLIDAGDVIVHLFRPEVRNFYNLEKMWSANLGSDSTSH